MTSCDGVAAAAEREAAFPGANFPGAMLQHHSFRELQVIDLDIDLVRERQLVNITGATSGKYRLVVQGRVITSELSMDSSANDIKNALYNAAMTIAYNDRETNAFSVWVNRGAKFLEVTVQFETDRTSPFTLLRVYPVSLVGKPRYALYSPRCSYHSGVFLGPNPQAVVSVIQAHSPFPSESFRLHFGPGDTGNGVLIPFDAGSETVEKAIEAYFPDDAVNVRDEINICLLRSNDGFILSVCHWDRWK